MAADKKYTPAIIAENHTAYIIPLYQRLFEWGEKQIKGLMEDLYSQFIANRNKDYYIGMLTATNEEELVDGQQRFTVVMLIGIALCQMTDSPSCNTDWRGFLSPGNGDNELRLRFKARPYDEEYLSYLVSGSTYSIENERMKKGLEYIQEFLKDKTTVLPAFSEYVFKHLAFFISHLPKEYEGEDLNKYFETMNAGGKGLENYEILKVDLLRNADDQEKKTWIWNKVSQLDKFMLWKSKDFSQDYLRNETSAQFSKKEITTDTSTSDDKQSKTILEIINAIGNTIPEKPKRNEKESDDYAVVSFPEFLLLVLDLTVNSDSVTDRVSYDTSKLLETFHTNLISKQDKELVTKFYDNLYWYRLLLDLFVIRVQRSDEGSNTKEYELVFGDNYALKQYQSMLYVSTTYHRWLKPFLKELKKRLDAQQKPCAEDLLSFLKQTDNNLRKNDSIQPENMTYDNIDRYWFWRLDYYLWENRNEYFPEEKQRKIAEKYIFRRNRSIEHVAPQNPKHDTADSLKWDEKNPQDIAIRDCFGNLCMISGGQNSSLSHESFKVKRAYVESFIDGDKTGSIESLKLLKVFQYEHWDKEISIPAHGKEMLEILRNSFPPNNNS